MIVDRSHPQLLFLFGRGEKNVDCENLKIGSSVCVSACVSFTTKMIALLVILVICALARDDRRAIAQRPEKSYWQENSR
ncbi:hypothetical protein NIES593_10005 [Hydrococcus rivularis NIES-593]|uniref:Uncharacterized protein n=1 Tax=Hydrococcus rivularis NIES-593 TaxID=1921803 RepID=A0A1U7HIX8_9CYAN|nr:hypothetical protein [Hydrococcus rivularis]OKH23546.1 hypothetical protein NIES593_10005 [Hydrococcus rivularis NIES-593]